MRPIVRLICLAALTLAYLVGVRPPAALAQAPLSITAQGTFFTAAGESFPFSLTFRPAGGPVSGTVDYDYERELGPVNCRGSIRATIEGRFAGGNGGYAAGTAHGSMLLTCEDGDSSRAAYDASWSGAFSEDGSAAGLWNGSATYASPESAGPRGQAYWSLAYSPQVFQAAAAPIVTTTYISAAYGLRVLGAPATETRNSSYWTAHELNLLDEALERLPAEVVRKLTSLTLVRSHVEYDGQGEADPTRLATFYECDLELSPNCTGPSASVRIFDRAHRQLDFPDDTNGDMQFKATLIHELAHALQAYREPATLSAHAPRGETSYAPSSLLEDWIAASGSAPDTGGLHAWSYANGWTLVRNSWVFLPSIGNELPTKYAASGPAEDMAESIMLYVFDPQRLKAASMGRYEFIRDRIFGGVEYDSGQPKPPPDAPPPLPAGTASSVTRR